MSHRQGGAHRRSSAVYSIHTVAKCMCACSAHASCVRLHLDPGVRHTTAESRGCVMLPPGIARNPSCDANSLPWVSLSNDAADPWFISSRRRPSKALPPANWSCMALRAACIQHGTQGATACDSTVFEAESVPHMCVFLGNTIDVVCVIPSTLHRRCMQPSRRLHLLPHLLLRCHCRRRAHALRHTNTLP